MSTLGLAFIEAKYKAEFFGLYFGTVIVDCSLYQAVSLIAS